jgi:PAS domain S-box-containing protein
MEGVATGATMNGTEREQVTKEILVRIAELEIAPPGPTHHGAQTTKQLPHGLTNLHQRIAELDRTAEISELQPLQEEWEKMRQALEVRIRQRAIAVQDLQQAKARLQAEITQRKRAEEAFQASEARCQALIEGSVQGVAIVNQEGRHLFANQVLLNILGYDSLASYLNHHMQDNIAPYERPRLRASWRTLLRENSAPARYEYQGIRADGTPIWLASVVTPTTWKGEPALMSTILDLTKYKQAEEARIRLEAQLNQTQKQQATSILAGSIAHDFNNMLAKIIGHTELALRDVPRDTLPWHNLQEVLTASTCTKDLIQRLVAFNGQTGAVREPSRLRLLSNKTLTFLRASLPTTSTRRASGSSSNQAR